MTVQCSDVFPEKPTSDGSQAISLPGVCIIDDDKTLCHALETFFASAGGVSWALGLSDWHEAVREVRLRAPAVALLDVKMNGANGLDLIQPLFEACPSTRVIILSGSVSAPLVEMALDRGAWGFIGKDVTLATLMQLINRVAAGNIALCDKSQAALGNG